MKQTSNIITLKIRYETDASFLSFIKTLQKQFNSCLRFTYNRLYDNKSLTTKELTALQKNLNNIEFVKSHLKNSAIHKAKEIIATSADKSVIFGGKHNFIKRCLNKISKEEFRKKRLLPIYSVGEANYKGNRLFEITDVTKILFKPDKNTHIMLNIKDIGRNRTKMLNVLKELQFTKTVPITYFFDTEYIYISVDNSAFEKHVYRTIKDRVMAIDILASIEIGRRGFEYGTQILPNFNNVRTRILLSLEELGICGHFKNWLELFSTVKKSGVKYRFPLAECLSASHFSKFYKRKMLTIYNF